MTPILSVNFLQLKQLEEAMYQHAKNFEFEQAARVRDEIKVLQEQILV